jgi:CRISPR-associated endonuclease/helicase Cas3
MNEQATSIYYSHTGNRSDGKDWQTLKDHLTSVAQLAQTRAKVFGAEDWAHLVGLLHDLGKYSPAFQQRLHGSKERADHATAGAKVVVDHTPQRLPRESCWRYAQ